MAVIEQVDQPSSSSGTPRPTALPEELLYLVSAFGPNQEASHRSKSYLVLSSYCQGVRSNVSRAKEGEADPGTVSLSAVFGTVIGSRLSEPNEEDVLAGLSFLSALFQVDWESAISIFQQEAVLSSLSDILDLYSSKTVSREVARLLSQASGHKLCRAVMPSECRDWLQKSVAQSNDSSLRAAAAIAIIKLSRGSKSDNAEIAGLQQSSSGDADEDLVPLMKTLVLNGDKDSVADAVEGLAYMSVDSSVKEALSSDSTFLSRLFSIIPTRKVDSRVPSDTPSHTSVYGVVSIISNICAHKPRLSAEDAQIQKLRRMAKGGAGSSEKSKEVQDDILEDEVHVKERGRRLAKSGALPVLVAAVRLTDSDGVRFMVSRALLDLAENKDNRGLILQSGGAKMLVDIIRKASSSPRGHASELDPRVLQPIQALAKLAITSSPVQVFGPDTGAIQDAIRPFAAMLSHSSSTLLQQFEAMMALTNISSQDADMAERVANADGLLLKMEILMLEDHVLVRRAAVELLCNLVSGSDQVFERYTGDGLAGSAKNKLHVILALSDVEDLQTRLAASGALAVLTASPPACQALYELENEKHCVLRLLTSLLDPDVLKDGDEDEDVEESAPQGRDPGLVHRGIVCARNFVLNLSDGTRKELVGITDMAKLVKAIINVLKSSQGNPAVLRPAAETLKALVEAGMAVSG